MSPVSIEPNKGVRLQLANYTRTRSYQGGGEFWETQFQQIIRQNLGDFLPRAEQDQPGSVLFQHFADAEEVCSKSEPLNGPVPDGELQRLERCIQTFKNKESDPQTDSNARKLIQAFKLPDPAKDPELYRVYGPAGSRKLLVLWGVEKESQTSLDPLTALTRVRERSGTSKSWEWLWWLLALPLLFLLGWFLLQHFTQPGPDAPPVAPVVVLTPSEGRNERVETTAPYSANPRATPFDTGASALPPALSSPAPDRTAPSASPAPNSPAISPERAPSTERPAPGGATPSSKSVPAATPTSASASATPSSSPSPARPLVATSPSATTTPPSSTPAASPRPAETVLRSSPTPPPRTPATPSSDPLRSSASLPPGASPQPGSSAPAGPPPAIEIINTTSDNTPHDGKVSVGLKAQWADPSGKPAKFGEITEWRIDGQPQLDAQGRRNVAPEFSAQLEKGVHRVEISGTDSAGRPLRAAANIDVQIKSSVGISPAK